MFYLWPKRKYNHLSPSIELWTVRPFNWRGWTSTPSPWSIFFILTLRTAYGLILALRTAYNLSTLRFRLKTWKEEENSLWHAQARLSWQTLVLLCLFNAIHCFDHYNLFPVLKKSKVSTSACTIRSYWIICHDYCVSWWNINFIKVKFNVCVGYNRIFTYCVPTLCILRTVKTQNIAFQKEVLHPHKEGKLIK